MFHVNRDLYNAQVTAFPNSLVLCHLVPSSPIASQTKVRTERKHSGNKGMYRYKLGYVYEDSK